MNSKYYQEQKNKFKVGDLVCYENSSGRSICGIVTEIKTVPKSAEQGDVVKIYWCLDRNEVDISPSSYPPMRKDGWIAAGLLLETGNLKIVSKNS